MDYTEKEIKQVVEVLKMPIESRRKRRKIIIEKKDGMIISSQRYPGYDPDMSDIAIKFYETIYGQIKIIDDKGNLLDCCFAGDTINSFNSLANQIPEAGKTTNQRTNEDEWPIELKDYYNSYHCLANFCLLPMCVGRRSGKLNKYDSMSIFLNGIKNDEDYKSEIGKHKSYYEKFDSYKKFIEINFLNSYTSITLKEYKEKNAYQLIDEATNRIDRRANDIANSNYGIELYRLFKKLNLID